ARPPDGSALLGLGLGLGLVLGGGGLAELLADVAHHVAEAARRAARAARRRADVLAVAALERALLGERDAPVVAVDVRDLGADALARLVVRLPVVALVRELGDVDE